MTIEERAAALAELRRVCQSGHLEDTGGLLAVARHVLATDNDVERWRRLLGLPSLAGYRFIDPPAAYRTPTQYGAPVSLQERLSRENQP